jgi:hypothetical protein
VNARRLSVVSLAAVFLVASGCLGSFGEESDLRVTEIDGDWTESGTLEILVTVRNAGSVEGTGTVVVQADVDGGDTYTDRRDVTLPAGGSETFSVEFEPPADEAGSGFDANAWME